MRISLVNGKNRKRSALPCFFGLAQPQVSASGVVVVEQREVEQIKYMRNNT